RDAVRRSIVRPSSHLCSCWEERDVAPLRSDRIGGLTPNILPSVSTVCTATTHRIVFGHGRDGGRGVVSPDERRANPVRSRECANRRDRLRRRYTSREKPTGRRRAGKYRRQ